MSFVGFEPAISAKRAATDPRLKLRGHWDRQFYLISCLLFRTKSKYFPPYVFLKFNIFYLRVKEATSNVECFQLEQDTVRSCSSERGNEHSDYIIHPVRTALINLLKPAGYET
jgi:hypothetical protein